MTSSTLSSRNNGSRPAKAEIARERTLPSISGKNKTRGTVMQKHSIHDRIQQYPGEPTINQIWEVVLSGMPLNSVYKEEYCSHMLGFKRCVGLMEKKTLIVTFCC